MNATELKAKFQTGDIPTQTDFENLIDAISNKQNVINLYYEDTTNSKEITYTLILGNIRTTTSLSRLIDMKLAIEIIKISKASGLTSSKPMLINRYTLNSNANFHEVYALILDIVDDANFDTGTITISSNSKIENGISKFYHSNPEVRHYNLIDDLGDTTCITINTTVVTKGTANYLIPLEVYILRVDAAGSTSESTVQTVHSNVTIANLTSAFSDLDTAIISNGDWETALEALLETMRGV